MGCMREGHTIVNADQALVHAGRDQLLGYVTRVWYVENSFVWILPKSCRKSYERVTVNMRHLTPFLKPIVDGVLQDAQTIDSQISDTEAINKEYCVLECLW